LIDQLLGIGGLSAVVFLGIRIGMELRSYSRWRNEQMLARVAEVEPPADR
jgi:hypothetical protein